MVRHQVPKRSMSPLESDYSDDIPELVEEDVELVEEDVELVEEDVVTCSESTNTTGDSMEVEPGGTCSESITTTDSMQVEPANSLPDTSSSSEGLPAAPHRRSPLLFTWSSRELLTLEAAYEPEDQERDTDSWESDVSMSGYAADVESGAESECPSEKELLQEEIWDIAVSEAAEADGRVVACLGRLWILVLVLVLVSEAACDSDNAPEH